VFVDDLYNKGDTFRATKLAMHSEGFNLDFVGVGVVVDFWHGSRKLDAIGFPFFTIFRRHDIGLTRVDKDLPKLLDNIKWRMHQHHTGRDYMPVKSLPVINNGKLYVGNDNTNEYCYDVETGNTLWVYESNLPSLKGNVSVAQFNKNHIYWSAYDGVVRCANAITGAHIWATKADLNLHSSPCLDPKNNRLYIGTEWDKQDPYGRGDIIALNMSNGHEIWRTPTRGMIPATPIYSQKHNMVVCGSNDYYVYFVNSNTGNIIKKIPTVGEVKGRPIITKDESIVIFNTLRGWVYGVDMLTHEVLWKRNIGEESYHQYPVTYDDKVVFTNSLGHIFCLNVQTGDVEWMTKLRGAIYWGVTLTDKCLIAVTINGYVVLVDKQNGDKLASDNIMRTAQVKGANCAQPAAYDGKNLVIVTNEKGILCYELDIDKVLA
jgi:outer membrane protein assembly factor BamB